MKNWQCVSSFIALVRVFHRQHGRMAVKRALIACNCSFLTSTTVRPCLADTTYVMKLDLYVCDKSWLNETVVNLAFCKLMNSHAWCLWVKSLDKSKKFLQNTHNWRHFMSSRMPQLFLCTKYTYMFVHVWVNKIPIRKKHTLFTWPIFKCSHKKSLIGHSD